MAAVARGVSPSRRLVGAVGVASTLLAAFGGRRGRRAALRGVVSASVASAGGPSAAAAAFAVGAALERPVAATVTAPVAAVWVAAAAPPRRPPTWITRMPLGAAVAVATTRMWPLVPSGGATAQRVRHRIDDLPTPDGRGLLLAVNPGAGPALAATVTDALRAALPEAHVVEVADGDDVTPLLREAVRRGAVAIGVAGGDGSVNAAATVAHEAGVPLSVVPAGTLNHFARDIGVDDIDDAIAVVRAGTLVAVDLGRVAGRPFLNTASVGSYVDLVDMRVRLEGRIGKWPAVVVALVQVLRRGAPLRVEIDGRARVVWMVFVGNGRYHPDGFAPSWRGRLDDGALDVRIVDASAPWSRTRLVAAVLTGRLGRCRVYEARTASRLVVESTDATPVRLALDGETTDGATRLVFDKYDTPLRVFAAPTPG